MRWLFISLCSVPHRVFLKWGPVGSTGTGLTHDLHVSMICCTSRSGGFSDVLPWRMTISIQWQEALKLRIMGASKMEDIQATESSRGLKCACFKPVNWLFIFFHSWRCYWYLLFSSLRSSRLLKIAQHETNSGINMQSGLIWFQLFLFFEVWLCYWQTQIIWTSSASREELCLRGMYLNPTWLQTSSSLSVFPGFQSRPCRCWRAGGCGRSSSSLCSWTRRTGRARAADRASTSWSTSSSGEPVSSLLTSTLTGSKSSRWMCDESHSGQKATSLRHIE